MGLTYVEQQMDSPRQLLLSARKWYELNYLSRLNFFYKPQKPFYLNWLSSILHNSSKQYELMSSIMSVWRGNGYDKIDIFGLGY